MLLRGKEKSHTNKCILATPSLAYGSNAVLYCGASPTVVLGGCCCVSTHSSHKHCSAHHKTQACVQCPHTQWPLFYLHVPQALEPFSVALGPSLRAHVFDLCSKLSCTCRTGVWSKNSCVRTYHWLQRITSQFSPCPFTLATYKNRAGKIIGVPKEQLLMAMYHPQTVAL